MNKIQVRLLGEPTVEKYCKRCMYGNLSSFPNACTNNKFDLLTKLDKVVEFGPGRMDRYLNAVFCKGKYFDAERINYITKIS